MHALDLKDLILSKGLTIDNAGVARITINRMLAGFAPRAGTIRKIAESLDVSTEVVFNAWKVSTQAVHNEEPNKVGAA